MSEDGSREGPSFHHGVRSPAGEMTESVTPHVVHVERVSYVVVRVSVIVLAEICLIDGKYDVCRGLIVQTERIEGIVGNIVERVAVGIAGLELKASGEAMGKAEHQPVVVGVADVLRLPNHAKPRIGCRGWQITEGKQLYWHGLSCWRDRGSES